MADAKQSKPGDLSTLDGNALVARLDLVKERALEDSVAADPYEPLEMSTAKTKAQITAERMDTDAVLDECAARLLDPSPEHLRAQILSDELERLRALIARVVARGPLGPAVGYFSCVFCFEADDAHAIECPWPALEAQALKP
jgi:hypothetical protein